MKNSPTGFLLSCLSSHVTASRSHHTQNGILGICSASGVATKQCLQCKPTFKIYSYTHIHICVCTYIHVNMELCAVLKRTKVGLYTPSRKEVCTHHLHHIMYTPSTSYYDLRKPSCRIVCTVWSYF